MGSPTEQLQGALIALIALILLVGIAAFVEWRNKRVIRKRPSPISYASKDADLQSANSDHNVGHSGMSAQQARVEAERIYSLMKTLYSNPHEFREINRSDYSDIDISSYEVIQRALENLGFHKLGDFIDATAVEHLNLNTFYQSFANRDGSISVAYFSLQKPGNPVRTRVLEFGTEFSDGFMIQTMDVKLPAHNLTHPKILITHLPEDTPVSEMLNEHVKSVEKYTAQNPAVQVVCIRSLRDLFESCSREQALKSELRKSVGYVTFFDLLPADPFHHVFNAEAIFLEIQELQKAEARLSS